MTYDGTDPNDDGTVEADVDNQSVSTEEVSVTDGWAMGADWIIAPYDNRYIAVDGSTGKVEYRSSGTSASGVLQSAIDAQNGEASHIHFANGRRDDPKAFFFDTTVTWDLSSALISGEGKNKSQLVLDDGANTDMWEFDPSGSAPIYELSYLKFGGNRANNTSGTGIINRTANEILPAHCEFRDWPNFGINFFPEITMDYNKFIDCWFLQNGNGGINIGTNGGSVKELDLIGCTLVGESPTNEVLGHPALNVGDSASATNINITGGTLKGSDVIRIGDGAFFSMTGVQGKELMGRWAIQVAKGTGSVSEVDIKSCQFDPDATNPVDTYIDLGDVAYVDVNDNGMRGSAASPLTTTADSVQVYARDNRGYTRSRRYDGTISSGTTTVTISHFLDTTPNQTDVSASFASDPSGAGTVYCSATSANDVTLAVPTAPSADVDVVADIEAHRVA